MEKSALESRRRTLKVGAALLLNFTSSVGIIVSNKYIFKKYDIHPVRLVAFHQMSTTFLSILGSIFGFYNIKQVNIYRVMPLSIFFTLFIVFSNLSLLNNTVGTYQILKCLSDPCILLLERFFYQTSYSYRVQLSFLPMILGVVVNSMYDIDFNTVGLIYGAIGIVSCAVYGILVGRKQRELEMNSMQLLYYQAPLSTIFLSVILIIGNKYGLLHENVEFFKSLAGASSASSASFSSSLSGDEIQISEDLTPVLVLALFTAVSAYFVNFSTFWIIGNTNIISYAVFSKLKLCAILISGVLFFHESMNIKQAIGMGLTLIGVFYYTFLKVNEKTDKLPK